MRYKKRGYYIILLLFFELYIVLLLILYMYVCIYMGAEHFITRVVRAEFVAELALGVSIAQ